jgi:hypothetical protein
MHQHEENMSTTKNIFARGTTKKYTAHVVSKNVALLATNCDTIASMQGLYMTRQRML